MCQQNTGLHRDGADAELCPCLTENLLVGGSPKKTHKVPEGIELADNNLSSQILAAA